MKKTTVLIADDHAFVRMGIASLLSAEDDIEVVGEAANGKRAVAEAERLSPDVAIVDLMMPQMDGAAATAEIKRLRPETKIILITSFAEADGLAHAIEAGADGVVMKNAENHDLVTAIRRVMSGRTAIPPEIRRQIAEDPPVPTLSPRQAEVLQSIIRGLSNKDIAVQLGISKDRVEEHVAAIFVKIGAANRSEAVAIALRKQILKS